MGRQQEPVSDERERPRLITESSIEVDNISDNTGVINIAGGNIIYNTYYEIQVAPGAVMLQSLPAGVAPAIPPSILQNAKRLDASTTFPHTGLFDECLGRTDELAQILDLLNTHKTVLLCGMAGIGKTALADAVARVYTEKSPRPIFWLKVQLSSQKRVFEMMQHLCYVSIQISQETSVKLDELLKIAAPGLVVLDDIHIASLETIPITDMPCSATSFDPSNLLEAVRRVVPGDIPILATSRLRMIGGIILEIGPLQLPPAMELLSRTVQPYKVACPPEIAQKLCELLGCHPLAILVAGAMVVEFRESIARVYNDLKTNPLIAEKSGVKQIMELLRESTALLTPEARQVLYAISAFPEPGVTEGLLQAYLDQDPLQETVATQGIHRLIQRNLLRRCSISDSLDIEFLSIHDLTYHYARHDPERPPQEPNVLTAAAERYLRKFAQQPEVVVKDLDNLLHIARQVTLDTQVRIMSLLVLGGYPERGATSYFIHFGRNRELLDLLDTIIGATQENSQAFQPTLHYLLGKRGDAAFELGLYDKAVEFYRQSLKTAPGLSRRVVLSGVTAKALAFCGQKKESKALFEQAYQYCQEIPEKERDCWLGFVLEQECHVAGHTKNFKGARRIASKLLKINQRLVAAALTPEERTINLEALMISLVNLGSAEFDLAMQSGCDCGKALELHQKAIRIAEEYHMEDFLPMMFTDLAEDYHGLNNREQAEIYFHRAVEMQQSLGMRADRNDTIQKMLTYKYSLPEAIEAALKLERS